MRRLLTLIAALLIACATPLAHADDVSTVPQPSSDGSNAVGACLQEGQVWLYVADVDGTILANQCVGTPANGEAALAAANVAIEHDKGGMICALGGRPNPCPTTFDGSFWNYWQTTAGKEWAFSQKGAKESKPAAGSIEGWCRNSKDTEGCTPPNLKIVIDGETKLPSGVAEADLADPEVVTPGAQQAAPSSQFPVGTVVAVGVIVVLGVVAVVILQRRKRSAGGPTPDDASAS